MKKIFKLFNAIDWIAAVLTTSAGIYLQNVWLVLFGALTFLFAWLKPAERLKARLDKRLIAGKKKPKDDSAAVRSEDAFYAELLAKSPEHLEENTAPVKEPVPNFYSILKERSISLNTSAHNVLKAENVRAAVAFKDSPRWS